MTTPICAELFPQALIFSPNKRLSTRKSHQNHAFLCFRSQSEPKVRSHPGRRPTNLPSSSNDLGEVNFLSLLYKSCGVGDYDEGLRLLETMVSLGHRAQVVPCTKLLNGLLLVSKCAPKAVRVMRILEEHGEPDEFAYNAFINGLRKLGQLDSASRVLDSMRARGLLPDVMVYTSLMASLYRQGKLDLVMKMLDQLIEDGYNPNIIAYNTLSGAMCENRDTAGALGLVSEMISKGIYPDEITYNALITSLCRDGMVDHAIELLGDMKNSEVLPTVSTYNSVLLGLCKAHRIDDAIGMVVDMVKNGCQPNQTSYVMLIQGIGFAGRRVEAIELANSLRKKKVITNQLLKRLKRIFPVNDINGSFTRTDIERSCNARNYDESIFMLSSPW